MISRGRVRRSQVTAALFFWVVVPAAVIAAGLGTDGLLGLPAPAWGRGPVGVGVGLGLILAGVGLIVWATRDLRRLGQGTPNPLAPPRSLVTAGAYGICRHPMFLGYDLAALGVVFLLRSWGALLVAYPLLIAGQSSFLRGEERRLARRFGAAYGAYRTRTPFLFPFPTRRR